MATLAGSSEPASGQAGCDAIQLVSPSTFVSRVCDMPDDDQRRRAVTLMTPSGTRLVRIPPARGRRLVRRAARPRLMIRVTARRGALAAPPVVLALSLRASSSS